MAKLIISAVSQLSNAMTTPPKFAITPNPNEMPASQDKAPVLLSIASAGTVEAEAFADRFAAKCSHIDAVEAIRRINALGEVIAACAAECKNVQFGYMNLEVSVSGTIPDTNAELNEANEAFYSAVPSEKIRKQFAAIETHIPTTVCPADVKRVRDVATGDGVIHGVNPYFIQGVNLTQGGAGEKIELFDAKGETKVCDVEVLDATSKVSLKVQNTETVEAGRYYLLVTTLAGGEMTLYPIGRMVTVDDLTPPAPRGPVIKKVVSQTTGNEGEWKVVRDTLTITTANATGEDAEVKLELYDKDGVTRKCDMPMTDGNMVERVDANTFKLTLAANTSEYPDLAWSNANDYIRRLTVTTATGSASLDLMPAA